MPRRTRSQAAKQIILDSDELEELDDDSDTREEPASASLSASSSDVEQHDEEDPPTKTTTTTTTKKGKTPKGSNNKNHSTNPPQHRAVRKKQKIMEPQLPESEYTEIEYVNQLKQNFTPKNGLAGDLPPIHDLDEIFENITLNAIRDTRFKRFVSSLNGRKLRVATVCSGTESPILALEMIISQLKKLDFESFDFKHLFSAEIVEYKQAYIERNFRPPLLFRDAIELHKKTAHTAYGAEREVPTRPDLLVAGFPCVDYSNLNNWRKQFGERGESEDTLRALVAYCEVHRPRIVILENISNAPWSHIGSAFEKVGYHFRSVKVDTKDFYLPQTRERGYAICIEKGVAEDDGEKMLDEWTSIFLSFQRRASSPFTDFIDADDEVIEQRKLERLTASEPRSSPNWSLYKIRHADVRRGTTFGNGRPITHWEEGGKCRPATWMDRPWFFSQVERVWDTIDVNHLRTLMVSGYDNSFKVRCIDISQGVDRDMDTRPLGIMGCITPCGMLYSTARGGQIQGREMLAMQGMPLSRLSLTRENQAQMQDLAGNAMSTTVVGPAMIAALMTSHSLLKAGPEETGVLENEEQAEEPMPTPSLMNSYPLSARSLTPYIKPTIDWLAKLKALAGLTVSLCSCEGPYGIGRYGLYQCMDCKFTACAACKVNPVHNYKPIPPSQLRMRKDPKMFRELLLWCLPSTIQPPELPLTIYEAMSGQYSSSDETKGIWKLFLETVELVSLDILMYKSIKRTQTWKVVYEGSNSILHLTIGPRGMHWDLFAKAPSSEPARSYFREILRHPIARMKVDETGPSILEGEWQICKPLSKKEKTITLRGTGDLLPSYENICGLPGSYQEQRVWSSIIVTGDDRAMEGLSLDVRGKYERIPNCGGALQSLHRRVPKAGEPTLFFFLDPRRLGPSQLDSWVFSTDPRRKTDNTPRDIILQLDSKWDYQQLRSSETSSVLASHRQWIDVGTMSLINCDSQMRIVSRIPNSNITLQINGQDCYDCYLPLLSVATNIIPNMRVPWEQGPWRALEISNFEEIGKFAWIWAKFMTWSPCTSWRSANADFEICQRCSPKLPRMAWTVIRGRERPIEDPVDAARCERDYKLRPSPFRIFTKIGEEEGEEETQTGHVCLAVNFKTMFHRACGTIAHRRDGSSSVAFYWRVSSNDDTDIPRPGSYRILNNNDEPEAEQPPHFRIPLRSDQRRSLRWALARESDDMNSFPEEEVEEAVLGPLNWRAEAKVIVHRKVRGGILADHVGFGKTAVILGLIDCQHQKDILEAEEPCKNAIPLKATCIVVPDILFDQWQGEISRFLGDKYTVLDIGSIAKLAATSVETFQSADIVLVSWAVFTGALYFNKLEETAGGPSPPKANSNVRMFEAWFDDVIGSIEQQVTSLQRDGPEAFIEAIQSKRKSVWGTDAYNRYLPSRRLRGKKTGMAGVSEQDSSLNQVADPAGSKNGTTTTKGNASKAKKTSSSTVNQETLLDRSNFGISANKETAIGDVKGTVLHMYRFQRLVIDEFTYLNQDRHALLASLKARSRWIMSGTPPIKGFAAAEKMARLLNVYLGKASDDDYEKSKYKRSESENFHFFRDVASRGWHFRRNGLAQYFIDVFMRQNTPEIPRIHWKVHYNPVVLSAVERILYLELKLFYESYNPQTKGEKKEKYLYDQRGRISEIVDTCNTPEQSLVKRSSHYDALPRWSSATKSIDTTVKLIQHRREEVNEVIAEIKMQSKAVSWLFHQLEQDSPRFDALKASLESNDYGDTNVSGFVQKLLGEAMQSYHKDDWKEFWNASNDRSVANTSTSVTGLDRRQTEKDEDSSDEEEDQQQEDLDGEFEPQSRQQKSTSQSKKHGLKPLPDSKPEKEKELREWTNKIRVNILALVERTRALRFVESGHCLQSAKIVPHCQSCGRIKGHRSSKDLSVLGKCGHIVCASCLEDVLRDNKCTAHDCRAAVDKQYVIPGRYFCMCQPVERPTPPGGTKIEALIRLLKDTDAIPNEDQAILFLQFADLEGPVTAAFEKHNISYASVGMSGGRGRSKIKAFAGQDKKKVAILQLGTENAAGLNLQNANHVIFFAPFAAKNHYEYQSTITQSSGRAIRFGQKKEVHIWNLVALNTLEVGILQGQDGRTLVRHADGEYELVLDDEIRADDAKGFEVPAFDWK